MVILGWLLVVVPLAIIGIGALVWLWIVIRELFRLSFWEGIEGLSFILIPASLMLGAFILWNLGIGK